MAKSTFLKIVILILITICIIIGCIPRDNPYDPANPAFVMPRFSCVIKMYDNESRNGVENARVIFSYKDNIDTVRADSGSEVLVCIEDNIYGNKTAVQILSIETPTHILREPFSVSLSKEGRDTTVLLHDRSAKPVSWDTLLTYADTSAAYLFWHMSHADMFSYYRLIRYDFKSKSTDTISAIFKKMDTMYVDNDVEENELYFYRIDVISLDSTIREGSEIKLIMPNRSPAISEITDINGDFFIYLRIKWERNHNNDFLRYVLFRSSDSISFDSIYSTSQQNDTTWLDTTISSAASRYYYYVVTIDENQLLSKSRTVSGINRVTVEQQLVYVHGGSFTMGRSGAGVPLNQQPSRDVVVSSFIIDKYEVTTERYVSFLNDSNYADYHDSMSLIGIKRNGTKFSLDSSWAHYPAVWLSWSNANNFCKWVGGRLPTEAEWEKAARGNDGRLYPWGNSFYYGQNPPVYYLANYVAGYIPSDDSGFSFDGAQNIAAAGNYSTGVSPYGIHDMAGNVSEWCNDWYANTPPKITVDPKGPEMGLWRSYRGGSFKSYPEELSAAYRFRLDPSYRQNDLGCRCVYDTLD